MFNNPYYRERFSSLLQLWHLVPHAWRSREWFPLLYLLQGLSRAPHTYTDKWKLILDDNHSFLSSTWALFKHESTRSESGLQSSQRWFLITEGVHTPVSLDFVTLSESFFLLPFWMLHLIYHQVDTCPVLFFYHQWERSRNLSADSMDTSLSKLQEIVKDRKSDML